MSEKYRRSQLFKLLVLQKSPLVQLYTSASHCKGDGNILGSHFVKAFSALLFNRSHAVVLYQYTTLIIRQ